jgi:hypothetical protein
MYLLHVKDIKFLIESIDIMTLQLDGIANQISSELDSDGRSLTDIRRTAVKDIVATMLFLQWQYIHLAEGLLHYPWWDEHGFANLTPEQKMDNASGYFTYTAFSAFHHGYSTYEGCLRQIHYSLDPVGLNQSTDGIYKVFNALITNFGLSINVSKFKELHIFLGLMRNTIHNIGCYRNANEPVKEVIYKGISYRFEHLKPVLFFYPEMLSHIVYDIGVMLADLIRDPIVMALPDARNPYRDNLVS